MGRTDQPRNCRTRSDQHFAGFPDSGGRVNLGRRMLLDRRCSDMGWNYGNRRVRGVDLPGYARTTATALLALAGSGFDVDRSLDFAEKFRDEPVASAADRAWLSLAIRAHGRRVEYAPSSKDSGKDSGEVITASVEILAATGGSFL